MPGDGQPVRPKIWTSGGLAEAEASGVPGGRSQRGQVLDAPILSSAAILYRITLFAGERHHGLLCSRCMAGFPKNGSAQAERSQK